MRKSAQLNPTLLQKQFRLNMTQDGFNRGEKYLLEPSLEGGKSEFTLGSSNSDITVPGIEDKAVIQFKSSTGWVLYLLGKQQIIWWYLRNQGTSREQSVEYELIKGVYSLISSIADNIQYQTLDYHIRVMTTIIAKPKKTKTDRKKGVPFKMMFRNHMDPDYYDPKANDKIFVPDNLTDQQKKIIETFPERDRGIFKEGENNIVEEDPLEAVVKKMKLKKKEKYSQKQKKVKFEGDGNFAIKNEDEEDEDSEGELDDTDEEEYDEEEGEDYEDDEEEESKEPKEKIDDANNEIKKAQKFVPAEGVKFTMYDEYGLPKNDGFNYQQFIVTDDLRPSDMYIEAPPEMVEQMYKKTGYHRDVDKEVNQMTEEEKAVFNCMFDDEGEYDELEDDFLMLANEGKAAIVVVESNNEKKINDNQPEFANKGVVIVRDEEEEKLKAMREKYKKQLGIGQPKENEEDDEDYEDVDGDEEDEDDEEEKEIDEGDFDQVLENEYADDQIGEAPDAEQQDLITKEMLDEAVDEFIESQKLRDRKLYKEFKPDGAPEEPIPQLKTKAQIDAEEAETETEKAELRRKALFLGEKLQLELDERDVDFEERDCYDHSSDDEQKWDCNTILSTFTNTDNHPGVIKTTRTVKVNNKKMELHKQFKVPIEGLMAMEIDVPRETKKLKKNAKGPYEQVEEIESEGSSSGNEDQDQKDGAEGESDPKDLKKQRKLQQKQEKRDKRKLKKELKLAFKTQNTKLVKATTTEIGALKTGVSVKKIY
ncbi:UNKNOWN [Stylonychia lemnae]|uniref:Uncharacterized protein n=1 Tax=Stylonychia lemnae TaxID=5949 RepID=A0A078B7W4_STYLE|nr:UNKNOWN [Stylonychia lemnae]|eukprot:CDW89648.1 UNKNOWN [Stylonychia lemnae]